MKQILPIFAQNLSKKVTQWNPAVPMEICMLVMLIATVTATSFQEAVQILSIDLQRDQSLIKYTKIYLPEIPHPNKIRFTMSLWAPRQITARYRFISYQMIRQMKKSNFFLSTHGKRGKKGVAVAFDLTEKGYYGEQDQYTVYTRGRSPAKLIR